ncbi:uncharacterized protein LOC114364031 [Ostrinia furnacalis]|uniref:uncharacterized protein LOC114364031 n=1 Tax=Ostrinia furnacalis TaxID=93504 RepID=UPI00103E5FEB|nr:uncharacterized protein LOC114364031 [Ostrinia furnacalis]
MLAAKNSSPASIQEEGRSSSVTSALFGYRGREEIIPYGRSLRTPEGQHQVRNQGAILALIMILRSYGPSSFEIADPIAPDHCLGLYHSSALRLFQSAETAPRLLQGAETAPLPRSASLWWCLPSHLRRAMRKRGQPEAVPCVSVVG